MNVRNISVKEKYIHKIDFNQYDEYNYMINIKGYGVMLSSIVNSLKSHCPNVFKFELLQFPVAYNIDEFQQTYYVYAYEYKQIVSTQYTSGIGNAKPHYDVLELYVLRVDSNIIKMREAFIKNYLPPFVNFFYHQLSEHTKTPSDSDYILSKNSHIYNHLLTTPIQSLHTNNKVLQINDKLEEVYI